MMILTYLQDEGYVLSKTVLQDEANIKAAAGRERSNDLKAFRKAVRGPFFTETESLAMRPPPPVHSPRAGDVRCGRHSEGDFAEAEKLVPKLGLKNAKSLLYAVHKQQYLEWIDGGEHYRTQVRCLETLRAHGHDEGRRALSTRSEGGRGAV